MLEELDIHGTFFKWTFSKFILESNISNKIENIIEIRIDIFKDTRRLTACMCCMIVEHQGKTGTTLYFRTLEAMGLTCE